MTCPTCSAQAAPDDAFCPNCGTRLAVPVGFNLGRAVEGGQRMTAGQLAGKVGLSAKAMTVNDLVGAAGALVAVIAYFVPLEHYTNYGSGSFSLVSHGGFYGFLVPVFALASGTTLLIPAARRFGFVSLPLSGALLGIILGTRAVPAAGYGVGWWLGLLGAAALLYAWTVRFTHNNPAH